MTGWFWAFFVLAGGSLHNDPIYIYSADAMRGKPEATT